MLRPLISALRTLTILSIPGRDTERFSRAVIFFPFAGAVLALVPMFFYGIAQWIVSQQFGFSFQHWRLSAINGLEFEISLAQWTVIALLALAVTTALTGGMHLDGLADAADALATRRSKEKILEILRDPHIGSFGAIAIVFDLLIKAGCWGILFARGNLAAIAASLVASRSLQSAVLAFFPSFSAKGLAVTYASGMSRVEKASVLILSAVVTVGWTYFLPLASGAVAMILMWIAGFACAAYFAHRIGGLNGDCIGAISEVGETAILVASALAA